MPTIYNSRNYQSLLAGRIKIRTLCHLQQQKLLELTSQIKPLSLMPSIYNSRNYQSLLAKLIRSLFSLLSTIVEIIRAYQPHTEEIECFPIYNSRNYQSSLASLSGISTLSGYLQQQKLLELTSPSSSSLWVSMIYNSRNYQSLLARIWKMECLHRSTIVEIIRAYQPQLARWRGF